jgi:hypothetical protein
METSQYRREFAAYRSARGAALYDFYTGATPAPRLAPALERYGDLWSRDSIDSLERARDETPAQFETERAGLYALLGAARLAYADARAREVTEELSRCESSSAVAWGDERLTAEEARARAAEESDAARRRELAARRLGAISACDDLRAARLSSLHDAARELGFETYGALFAQATRTDYEGLLAAAEVLLARTAHVYESRLAAWAARRLPNGSARDLSHADEPFFARLADFDRFFPAHDARTLFEAALGSGGLRVERRASPRVEETTSTNSAAGRARCLGVRPPEDVRLAYRARAGADFYRDFFYEGGRAEHLAWTSAELAARHPEFVHSSDGATQAGFGFLLRSLFSDRAWLAAARGVRASEAEEIARACALVDLHDARRTCALAREEFELLTGADPRSESFAESCAERRREATGFHQTAAPCLFDLLRDDVPRASARLRARLFAAALAEHLRSRHGARWWSSRAAGDELIDLWNTGSRYAAEELARLALSAAPDAELLASSLDAAASAS